MPAFAYIQISIILHNTVSTGTNLNKAAASIFEYIELDDAPGVSNSRLTRLRQLKIIFIYDS